jgi:AmmeMemoRadiSam system protein B
LPFLQYRFGGDFKFVPLTVLSEFPDKHLLESCRIVGKSIGKVLKKEEKKWIVLSSSDFSHFISQENAERIDKYTIKSILKLNEEEFIEKVKEKNASICGFGSIATCIAAAKEMGAKKAELLKYGTSGDITEEYHSVVGYASIIFY